MPLPPAAGDAALEDLRQRGAAGFDPVGLRYLEALARRSQTYRGAVAEGLVSRLQAAMDAYGRRLAAARQSAAEALARAAARHPMAADELQALFAAGDLAGLTRRIAALDACAGPGPLAGLMAYMAGQGDGAGQGGAEEPLPAAPDGVPATPVVTPAMATDTGEAPSGTVSPARELKSLRYFRSTWSRLSAEQQLAQALAQAPENAGPLNSHLLVLRALQLMQDVSPDYLQRFMSYADTLLWLEQVDDLSGAVKRRNETAVPAGRRGARSGGSD
jgi:hypothetical protein